MFSVNIDKLIKMTERESDGYSILVDAVCEKAGDSAKVIATMGAGIPSFKMAAKFVEKGNRVMYVDGDISVEIFLSKYKLGKSLKGLTDYIYDDEELDDLICVTNNESLDIIFTGDVDGVDLDDEACDKIAQMLDSLKEDYDYIIIQSDTEANIAKLADATVVLEKKNDYDQKSTKEMVTELDEKGCFVVGVAVYE